MLADDRPDPLPLLRAQSAGRWMSFGVDRRSLAGSIEDRAQLFVRDWTALHRQELLEKRAHRHLPPPPDLHSSQALRRIPSATALAAGGDRWAAAVGSLHVPGLDVAATCRYAPEAGRH